MTRKPFHIIAIAAITLDGRIARHKNHFSDWTSKEDKKVFHKLLRGCDAVIVGRNTYTAAWKPLQKRKCIILTHHVKSIQKEGDHIFLRPTKRRLEQIISEMKWKRIALLGGSGAYTYFLKQRLIDEFIITLEPLLFGAGISLIQESIPFRTSPRFHLLSLKKLNTQGSLLLRYRVKNS